MERFAADYVKLNETFNPRHFDPQRGSTPPQRAGMKYVVFTTKHHDGFCMFDTKQTDYRTTDPSCPFHTNPRADVVKAVFDAFRGRASASGHTTRRAIGIIRATGIPPGRTPRAIPTTTRPRTRERWASFVKFTHDIIEEIVSSYGPIDILWLDGGQVQPADAGHRHAGHCRHGPPTPAGPDHRRSHASAAATRTTARPSRKCPTRHCPMSGKPA